MNVYVLYYIQIPILEGPKLYQPQTEQNKLKREYPTDDLGKLFFTVIFQKISKIHNLDEEYKPKKFQDYKKFTNLRTFHVFLIK